MVLWWCAAVDKGTAAFAQKPPGDSVPNNVQKSTFSQLVSDAPPLDSVSAQTAPNTKTSAAADNDNGKQSTQFGHSGDHTAAALSSGRSDELTLGDLRDSGIALNQIRQEAINIFLEATRTHCDKTTRSELIIPNSITEKDLEKVSLPGER
jgi:hypothetical protein